MKHSGVWAPEALRRVKIQEKTKVGEYLVVDDLAGPRSSLVQMGILEIHTWNCPRRHLERPDRVVFDLDPDPAVGWAARGRSGAGSARSGSSGLGLESFVKTTGGKGLHVVVPLRPASTWEESFAFSRAISEEMERAEPRAYTTAMPKAPAKGQDPHRLPAQQPRATRRSPPIRRARAPAAPRVDADHLGGARRAGSSRTSSTSATSARVSSR